MYTEKLLDLFKNPKHNGRIIGADAVGEAGNMSCGDILKIYLKLDGEKIVDAKFQTLGCPAAIAAAEVTCSLAIGKNINNVDRITNKDVLNMLGDVPPSKVHCSILAEQVIKDALKDYKKRQAALEKQKKK
ncbi:MAG: iron-sulfur cluster assembly scaffold protein [Firmicutes bacterium]|nr:iron-sulfur cluster assembly scaffold protein [Bacillota bacterium]MCL2771034.1 iron-sulfur cluster assembly scaffold protein [Bacillota bacterium]